MLCIIQQRSYAQKFDNQHWWHIITSIMSWCDVWFDGETAFGLTPVCAGVRLVDVLEACVQGGDAHTTSY